MGDIRDEYREYKSDIEKQEFIKAQQKTIVKLMKQVTTLEEENAHLKSLISSSMPLIGPSEPVVEKIILSPEEALIESQIAMIQSRGYAAELSLEDVKKLDLLLKNKALTKKDDKTIGGSFKKLSLSREELLKLAHKPDGSK